MFINKNLFFKKDMNETEVNHYIARKISAFIRAVYLVTDLFPQLEPLKWGLRSSVIEISRHATVSFLNTTSQTIVVYKQISDQLLNFLTIVDAAHHIQLISAMNLKIITDETYKFISELQTFIQSSCDQGVHLDEALFSVQKSEEKHSNMSFKANGMSFNNDQRNQQMPTQSGIKINSQTTQGVDEQKSRNAHNLDVNLNYIQKKSHVQHSAQSRIKSAPNYERRVKVLAYLSKQRKASIPEITTFVGGVSDKTIQRELQGLIEEGAVVREGDRRWARYSLAT